MKEKKSEMRGMYIQTACSCYRLAKEIKLTGRRKIEEGRGREAYSILFFTQQESREEEEEEEEK